MFFLFYFFHFSLFFLNILEWQHLFLSYRRYSCTNHMGWIFNSLERKEWISIRLSDEYFLSGTFASFALTWIIESFMLSR